MMAESLDTRIKRLQSALVGFNLVTLEYRDGRTRMATPAAAIREVLDGGSVARITGDTGNGSGRFPEILQAVIDLDEQ